MSFDEQVARNFNQERLTARLTELFGALALILACVDRRRSRRALSGPELRLCRNDGRMVSKTYLS